MKEYETLPNDDDEEDPPLQHQIELKHLSSTSTISDREELESEWHGDQVT